jgi:PadR family transcriptional regulator PadR
MNEWVTQLRKGLVEFCILTALDREQTYGYQLVQRLREIEELAFTESTVYPVLNRLLASGLIRAEKRPSRRGPPRRYFSLTRAGLERLGRMREHWAGLCRAIDLFQTSDLSEDKDG